MNKHRSKNISISAAVITLLIGTMVIVGWFTYNDFLMSIVPGSEKMKFNVALGFVFSSIVLLLYHFPVKKKIWHRIPVILSVVVSLMGLLTLLEYVYDLNFGIDELFFKGELPTTVINYAGRMSPLSALNFILIGVGLLLLNKEKAATYQFYYLAGISFISILMLIGFNFIADIPTFIRLEIHVAIGFITLSVAIWFAQPMLHKKISFESKLFTGFTAVILLIVVLSIFSSYYSNKRIATSQLVNHTNDVLSEAQQTLSLTQDIESGGRGYIITGDSNYLEYFTIAKDNIYNHVNKLRELTKDNTAQQIRIDFLSALIDRRIGFSLQCIQARNEKGLEAATELTASLRGKFYTDKIRKVTSEIQQDGKDFLIQRQKENDRNIVSFNRAFVVFLAAVFSLLLIILVAILNNIKARKIAEKQSAENEEQIQTIFSAAPDAVIVIDDEGRILKWNQKSETLFGWTADEVLGKSLRETIIPHRYREAHQNGMKRFLATGEGPVLGITIEIQAINKNNVEFDVALSISPTIVQGKHLFIGFVRDITERKKTEEKLLRFSQELEEKVLERTEEIKSSEKKYRYLFENNPMPMWVIELNAFKFLDVNEMAILQYGYSREEFLSMTTLDIRADKDKELFLQSGHLFEMGRANYSKGIWNHRKKDGTIMQVETIGHKIIFEGVPARLILSNDVTEKLKAEEKILGSEKKLRSLIENSNEVIIITDINGKRLFVSEGINRMLGYTPEEFMQFNIFETVSPEEAHSVELILQKVIDNPHQPFTIYIHLRHKNGSWRWIEAALAGFLDVPDLNGIVINYRDVTERKEAEEAILRAETNYREIFDKASDAIYVHEMETGKVIEVNNRAYEITGYTREELLNADPQEFITDDPNYTLQHAMINLQKAAAGEPQLFEWLNKNKDGSHNWLEINLKKATIAGQERILAFFREINDRKKTQLEIQKLNEGLEQKVIDRTAQLQKSNELFSNLFNHNPGAIVISRLSDAKLINVNDAFLSLFGFSHKEEVIGRTAKELNIVGFYEKREEIAQLIKENRFVKDFEIKTHSRHGDVFWISSSVLIIEIESSPCLFSISVDISNRKKAEEQLQAVNKELEAFSYSVSHDLRAPLRAINGYSKMLEEEYNTVLGNEGKRLLVKIGESAKRMSLLIDDLLEFSRLGRKEIHKSPIEMTEFFEATIGEINTMINHTAVIKIHKLHSIDADKKMIKQVIINLLSNAIKYSSKSEKPSIEIRSYCEENEIIYCVSDNGVGFSNQYVDKLFGVFQRLHLQADFEGTGVGLALVKRIIDKHGGRVWASGELNKGATFSFSLPAGNKNSSKMQMEISHV